MTTWLLRTAAGDFPALGGYLRLQARGLWFLTLDLHSDDVAPAEGSAVKLLVAPEVPDGEAAAPVATLPGTALRARRWPGSASLAVSVVGGAGGLERTLPPLGHVLGSSPVPVGLLVRAIADAAGEQLAPGVEATLDAFQVVRWHRVSGSASQALDLLVDLVAQAYGVELGWRVLPTGEIWAGVETWPAVAAEDRALGPDLDDGRVTYAPRGLELLPGQTVDGARAAEVLYTLAPPRLRAEVRREVPGARERPLALELYSRAYSATVRAQDATTGHLDVSCDDARIGDLRAVPLRCGIPGARIVLASPAGERVRIAFDGADPRLPYAVAHDQASAADRGVARLGEAVQVGTLSATCGGVPVLFTLTPAPPPGSLGETNAPAEMITLGGYVTTGSAEVLIR